jgi:hypothetical protein
MLAGHFQSTRERVKATEGLVLVLRDTKEFSCKRQEKAALGLLRTLSMQSAFGMQVVACGILMHSSLVVASGGVPLLVHRNKGEG